MNAIGKKEYQRQSSKTNLLYCEMCFTIFVQLVTTYKGVSVCVIFFLDIFVVVPRMSLPTYRKVKFRAKIKFNNLSLTNGRK